MAAGTPAIMPTFQKAGQKKEEKEAIGVYKLSFNGVPQELAYNTSRMSLARIQLQGKIQLQGSLKYIEILALFWVTIILAEFWDPNNKEEDGNICFFEGGKLVAVTVSQTPGYVLEMIQGEVALIYCDLL